MGCKAPLTRVIFSDGYAKVCGHHLTGGDLIVLRNLYGSISKTQPIPCGQCIGCRLDYSREWATRCELEMREWENNWFLTLTYDDEHLPSNVFVDENTGELIAGNPLVPNDLTQFIKSLRKKWQRHYREDNIRFYACGEYGETNGRPHYHIILFNCAIRDLQEHHKNKKGNAIYTSEEIEQVWGKGIIGITQASWETAAYTARYMLKKQKGNGADEFYQSKGITKEFCRMSRMPGIASAWYEKNKDRIWEADEIILAKGRIVRPPKYYEELYDQEIEKLYQATNEEDCKELKAMLKAKEERKLKRETAAIAAQKLKMSKTSVTMEEQLQIEKRELERRTKQARRTL